MTPYRNREDAARQLIPYLEKFREDKGVVFAVPRGGVPVAFPIARHFHFPLELLMTKKIGHPANPEFAIGAVGIEDHYLDESQNLPASYINEQVKEIRHQLDERYRRFMGDRKPVSPEGKTVIIIDDGIATGNTILSSLHVLRRQHPAKIIIAVPVAPIETAKKLAREVDEFICPFLPAHFFGVGHHYEDFTQVSDDEVVQMISEANSAREAA